MPDDRLTIPRPLLLVHGAWHGAWCWASLQAELDKRGVASYAIDLPGHGSSLAPFGGLHDDADHVRAILDRLRGDRLRGRGDMPGRAATDAELETQFVLVGHSYGGAVITQAALQPTACSALSSSEDLKNTRSDIAHLVYVAAFALERDESVASSLRSFADNPVAAESDSGLKNALQEAVVPHADGSTTLDLERAGEALYEDCQPAEISAALARLCPQPGATMQESAEGSPRETIPSTYIRCLRDRAISPAHQALMARRCEHSIDFDTDHSPFMSHTIALADLLEDIATRPGHF